MNRNRALQILFIVNGLFVFAGSLLGPLYAIYAKTIDSNISTVTISWAAFLLSATLFSVLVAKFGDMVHEVEYFLIIGFLIRAVVWLSYVFIPNLFYLVVAQVVLGLGEAIGTPAFDVLFSRHLDSKSQVLEYSSWKVISNLTTALGTIIGGYFVSLYGFAPLFVSMSFVAVICAVLVYTRPRSLL